jgi:hypothetical protein
MCAYLPERWLQIGKNEFEPVPGAGRALLLALGFEIKRGVRDDGSEIVRMLIEPAALLRNHALIATAAESLMRNRAICASNVAACGEKWLATTRLFYQTMDGRDGIVDLVPALGTVPLASSSDLWTCEVCGCGENPVSAKACSLCDSPRTDPALPPLPAAAAGTMQRTLSTSIPRTYREKIADLLDSQLTVSMTIPTQGKLNVPFAVEVGVNAVAAHMSFRITTPLSDRADVLRAVMDTDLLALPQFAEKFDGITALQVRRALTWSPAE